MPHRLLLLIFLLGFPGWVKAVAVDVPKPKRVLLLYSERQELPAIRAIDSGLREALAARGGVEVFAEYFDFSRFPADQHSAELAELVQDRYRRQKLDMVVSIGFQALKFALDHQKELFPEVPITYCGIERHQLLDKTIPTGTEGVELFYDFDRTIELGLKLQPGVREVVCVFGTSDFDQQIGQGALASLAKHPELRVRVLNALPYSEIIEQVRHLPSDSMVLYGSMLRDFAGQQRPGTQAAEDLSKSSPVPVYGVASHHLEKGLLGGAMMDYAAHGREIGAMAVARLDGHSFTPTAAASSPWMVNWQSLKKWKIPEKRVPTEAVIRFKQLSLWQEHRGLVIGICAVVAVQSFLIAGLLVSGGMRRRAELALAESEERMGLAADAAGLGMWAWDVSGNEGTWMTENGKALFGLKPHTRIDYELILERIHPDDRAAREDAIKRALETKEEYEMEYRVMLPDGTTRWVNARGRCVDAPNGKDSKLVGVSMDVTTRKQAEQESAQQREELSHLSRVVLVGEMATSLAHELNQPLTAIVTNASAAQRFIARGEMDPEELRELLADIAADGRRAGEVIRGIKGMTRKAKSQRSELDLNEIIAEVLRLVRADAFAHGCTLSTDLEKDLPLISGDAVQLQQVLLNLIINAFDSMRNSTCNSCRVEIVSRSIDQALVEVSVRDFGPGLPDEPNLRIFDHFFSTKPDGMGMGLAIARSITEAHGGKLGAENAEGGGARFWLRLPSHTSNEIPV